MELVKSWSVLSFRHSRWWPVILFGIGLCSSMLVIFTFNLGMMILPQNTSSSSLPPPPPPPPPPASSGFLIGPSINQLANRVWSFILPGSSQSHTSPQPHACMQQGTESVQLFSPPTFSASVNLQHPCKESDDNFPRAATRKSSDTSSLADTNHTDAMSSSTPKQLKYRAACDIFIGKWVEDDTYPLYKPDSCPFVDKKFNCQQNGRQDAKYTKWRWAPRDCILPRFSGKQILKTLRGKRLAFVGDSLNRNQWESMLCMIRESLANKSRIARQHGSNRILKFLDYNCTVEFYKTRYLVDMNEGSGETNYTISLDRMDKSEMKWRGANILVFNTAHWWGPGKIGKGENRFQEGDKVHANLDVIEAYKRALFTWAKWVDTRVDPHKTLVFFRTYSPKHFRGGAWNAGGHCEDETEPSFEDFNLPTSSSEIRALDEVLGSMKVPVHVLDVMKLSAYRKDAHPSVYWHPQQLQISQQDCGHWCLPGVPDTWNELLYHSIASL